MQFSQILNPLYSSNAYHTWYKWTWKKWQWTFSCFFFSFKKNQFRYLLELQFNFSKLSWKKEKNFLLNINPVLKQLVKAFKFFQKWIIKMRKLRFQSNRISNSDKYMDVCTGISQLHKKCKKRKGLWNVI